MVPEFGKYRERVRQRVFEVITEDDSLTKCSTVSKFPGYIQENNKNDINCCGEIHDGNGNAATINHSKYEAYRK